MGKIGSSPEIYTSLSLEKDAGFITAFSGSAINYSYQTPINEDKVLGILHHSYEIKKNQLLVDFSFSTPDDTREVFVLPGNGNFSIVKSTTWIKDIEETEGKVKIIPGGDGFITLKIKEYGVWSVKEMQVFAGKEINVSR